MRRTTVVARVPSRVAVALSVLPARARVRACASAILPGVRS